MNQLNALSNRVEYYARAVNNFSKNAEVQAKAVDDNIKQTQVLVSSVTQLVAEVRTALSARPTGSVLPPAVPRSADTPPSTDPRQQTAKTASF